MVRPQSKKKGARKPTQKRLNTITFTHTEEQKKKQGETKGESRNTREKGTIEILDTITIYDWCDIFVRIA